MNTNKKYSGLAGRLAIVMVVLFIAAVLLLCKSAQGQNKCFLIGYQAGFKLPEYHITTDSLVVDSLFRANKMKNAWERMSRDSVFICKMPNKVVYAEYGTFTELKNGTKKFDGASDRKYLKKRYKR